MGMTGMFVNGTDFSNWLEQSEPWKVSKVVHKAFIEVNEEGAETAASLDFRFTVRSGIRRPLEYFIADRPFTYTMKIKNRILFMWRFVGNKVVFFIQWTVCEEL